MNMDRYIIDLLGMDSYVKGRRYYSWYVDLNDEGKSKEGYYFKFSVESERTYRHYNVKIDIKDYEIVSYSCNCEQFKGHHTCKHVAACLLYNSDIILGNGFDRTDISNNILAFINNLETLQNATNKNLIANEDYERTLIKLGSQYENCADDLDNYLRALTAGDEATQRFAQASLQLSIRAGEMAQATGIPAQSIERIALQLASSNEQLQQNQELAADAAVRYIRLNTAIAQLYDNLDNYKEVLDKINQSGFDAIDLNDDLGKSYSEIKKYVADIFNTSEVSLFMTTVYIFL